MEFISHLILTPKARSRRHRVTSQILLGDPGVRKEMRNAFFGAAVATGPRSP